ncbi:hypothetical protein GCM10007875_28200 [Limnobacter litoralis]|uniref:Secreted protein n=1 Tax=Limnobacter litoralis TaxID=481366 RepID=A0ABQ5YTA1_9BURK|nr:hypothetical protein GCM10007875_28200 [Limnobacter litoralis]
MVEIPVSMFPAVRLCRWVCHAARFGVARLLGIRSFGIGPTCDMFEWLAKPRVVARASKARVLISVYSGKPSASDMHTCDSRLSNY